MSRSLALGILLASGLLSANPVPPFPPDAARDREGNPLPKGATARLGSLALRGPSTSGLTFSPDGKQLLALGGEAIHAWDAGTGAPSEARAATPPQVEGAVPRPTAFAGERVLWLASADSGRRSSTAVVTALDGKELARFRFEGNAHFPTNIFFIQITAAGVSPDGKYLAMIPDGSKAASVYDLETGKRLHSLPIEGARLHAVYLSSNPKMLFVRQLDQPIRRWDLVTGKELPPLEESDSGINLMEVSPDGKRIVTRRRFLKENAKREVIAVEQDDFLVVREGTTGKPVGRLEVGAWPEYFRFVGPDAVVVLAAKVRWPGPPVYALSRWNLATLKREWEVPCPQADWIAASPDGKRVAISARLHVIHLYDAATGKPAAVSAGHAGPVAWVGYSTDGKTVTTAGSDEIMTWTPAGERKAVASPPEFRRARMNPPGDGPAAGNHLAWLAFTDAGKVEQLVGWDADRGAVAWQVPLDDAARPNQVLHTHDGKQVVAVTWADKPRAGTVAVYDGPAGKKLREWALPEEPQPGRFDLPVFPASALSGDGRVLFVGKDGVVGYDVATGKEAVRVDTGPIEGTDTRFPQPMAVSPDGSRIAVFDKESLRVVDVKSGKLLARHEVGRTFGMTAKFSPDGKRVAVWAVTPLRVMVCDAESEAKPRVLDGGVSRPTCVAFSPNGAELAVGYRDGTALVWDLTAK